VLAEARAAAEGAGRKRLVILSANPTRGRIIRAGRYFVHGQPLDETVFADDPAHPRTSAEVTELLGGDLTGVETPDAETAAELARLAATIDRDTLPVGAVEFFSALLQARTPPREVPPLASTTAEAVGTLVVCGSAASWAQRCTEAADRQIPVFARPHDLAAVARALQSSGRVLLGIGDGGGLTSAALCAELATATATLVQDSTGVTAILLEGGATARAVMDRLGWTRLQACQVSAQGVGVLRPAGAAGPLLFIKPGSYPWPPEIWP